MSEDILQYFDIKNNFYERFNRKTGEYVRSGVLFNDNGSVIDTGIDPFKRDFPSLIDVGIMGHCVCAHSCTVDCYQRSIDCADKPNMSIENFEKICKQSKGKVFSFALGGRGDPDCHENFEEILKMSNEYSIVPNFTTSGICMTPDKAELCKKYCGAVAVSWHGTSAYTRPYTHTAIEMLLNAGVKTNIHFVLNYDSINNILFMLENDIFPKGINAVVFLLYKPIGLGRSDSILTTYDENVKKFFKYVDENELPFKVGFDSCCCPAVLNYMENVNMDSMDYCEAARHSMYIDADFNAMPCSFCNQDSSYFVPLDKYTIQEAWDGDIFNDFRQHFIASCRECKDRHLCHGGCPVTRDIVLCNRECKDFK